jgi:capsular polysaccharide biosynthesis protein
VWCRLNEGRNLLHIAAGPPYGSIVESRVDRDGRPQQVDLPRLVATAKRRRWTLLAGTLAATFLVAGLGSQPPSYKAVTTLLVGPIGGDYKQLRAAQQQAQTYAALATSGDVLRGASRRLRSAPTTAQLRAAVAANADYTTRLLTISATSHGRDEALATAAAIGAQVERLARARVEYGGSQLSIVQPARITAKTGGPAKTLIVIAAFTGLLATLAAIVARERKRPNRGPSTGLVSRPA